MTSAPETSAPETSAPETSAPETSPPAAAPVATALVADLRPDLVPPPDGLVDAHVHVTASPDHLAAGAVTGHLSPRAARDVLAAAGVRRAVVMPALVDHLRGYAAANAALRQECASSGGRHVPLARLGGRRVTVVRAGAWPEPWSVRRAARARGGGRGPDLPGSGLAGFAGVTLMPHLDGVPDPAVLAEVRARRLPVLVHAGTHTRPRDVARRLLPSLQGCDVVLAHLGAFPCSEPDLRDAVALAAEGQVLLDTSAAWLASFIAFAAREVPDRVLFGSDTPLMDPAVAWAHVASALPREAVDRVARETASRVYGLAGSRADGVTG